MLCTYIWEIKAKKYENQREMDIACIKYSS